MFEFVRAGLSQGSEAVLGGLSLVSDYCFLSPVSQTSLLMADAFPSLYSLHTPALRQLAEAGSERKSWQGVNIFQCFITTELK